MNWLDNYSNRLGQPPLMNNGFITSILYTEFLTLLPSRNKFNFPHYEINVNVNLKIRSH